jgi:hypothetical protein
MTSVGSAQRFTLWLCWWRHRLQQSAWQLIRQVTMHQIYTLHLLWWEADAQGQADDMVQHAGRWQPLIATNAAAWAVPVVHHDQSVTFCFRPSSVAQNSFSFIQVIATSVSRAWIVAGSALPYGEFAALTVASGVCVPRNFLRSACTKAAPA